MVLIFGEPSRFMVLLYWVSQNLPQICTASAYWIVKHALKQMQYRFAVILYETLGIYNYHAKIRAAACPHKCVLTGFHQKQSILFLGFIYRHGRIVYTGFSCGDDHIQFTLPQRKRYVNSIIIYKQSLHSSTKFKIFHFRVTDTVWVRSKRKFS